MPECTELFRFGSFELDCASRELRKSGLRIKLEEQPFRVLSELVSHHGEIVTREELKNALWPDDTYVDFERGLTRVINKVRVTLADQAANPRFVETVPRRGYRFVAPVSAQDRSRDLPNSLPRRQTAGNRSVLNPFSRSTTNLVGWPVSRFCAQLGC